MKNISARRILLRSAISMLLCLAMLVGTTYAWFTDSVSSKNNIIKTGTLQVDMEHKVDGSWISLRETPDHQIFNYSHWVPGYTQTATVKIQNEGSLAFKYQLTATLDEGTPVVGPNGEQLSDVVDVYMSFGENVADDPTDLSDGSWWYLGTLTQILEQKYVTGGYLLPVGADYSGALLGENGIAVGEITASVALSMRLDAENEYNSLSVGDVSMLLLANQMPFEIDSFDNLYDNIPDTELVFDDGATHGISNVVINSGTSANVSSITVSGEGTVLDIHGGYYDCGPRDNVLTVKDGATVNIYGGTLRASTGESVSAIKVEKGGTLNMYGGTLSAREAIELIDAEDGAAVSITKGTFVDWDPIKDGSVDYIKSGSALISGTRAGSKIYEVRPLEEIVFGKEAGVYEVIGSTSIVGVPLISTNAITTPLVINGGGATVEILPSQGNIPTASNLNTYNNPLVVVNDITYTGIFEAIYAGQYDWYGKNCGNTEFNRVNMINPKIVGLGNLLSTGMLAYGTTVLNDCVMTGATRYENDPNNLDLLVCDVAITNGTTFVANGGKIGHLFVWNGIKSADLNGVKISKITSNARITAGNGWLNINSGTIVDELCLDYRMDGGNNAMYPSIHIKSGATVGKIDMNGLLDASHAKNIIIDDGANVGGFVDGGVEYATLDEWRAAHPAA